MNEVGGHTREELQAMVDAMEKVRADFYYAAVGTKCHGFIEFCGLMGEYVKVCQQSLHAGVDFAMANTHSEKPLVMHTYNAEYLAEKLDCIFGPTLRADDEVKSIFAKALLESE